MAIGTPGKIRRAPFLPRELALLERDAWVRFTAIAESFEPLARELLRCRLAGTSTPEMERSYRAAEPEYEEAKKALHAINKRIIGVYWVHRRCAHCLALVPGAMPCQVCDADRRNLL